MAGEDKRYTGEQRVVRYNAKRCIHYAACVRGLPSVFDPAQRPWIVPDNANADALSEVVQQCPTGALHVERSDGSATEQPPAQASLEVAVDGPLYLRGALEVQSEDGTPIVADTRIALCRCGMSSHKPFGDGTHRAGFHDAGALAPQAVAPGDADGPLRIQVRERGPYRVGGSVTLRSGDGSETLRCRDVALCRCGASEHKPFCDGSHRSVAPENFR